MSSRPPDMNDPSRRAAREANADLVELVGRLRGRKVLVIADLIVDEFVVTSEPRVSREAPVLILEYDTTQVVPGGAGNAANNVASLGGAVTLVSLAGRDEAGRRVVLALKGAIDRAGLSRPGGYHTPVKTRILAGGIHSAKQQVVRIDRFAAEPVLEAHRATAERAALKAVKGADAVLRSEERRVGKECCR